MYEGTAPLPLPPDQDSGSSSGNLLFAHQDLLILFGGSIGVILIVLVAIFLSNTVITESSSGPEPASNSDTDNKAQKERLMDQARVLARAIKTKNHTTLVDYMPDRIVRAAGGRAVSIAMMRQAISNSPAPDIINVGPVRGPVCNNQTCLAIVITTSRLLVEDVAMTTVGFLLAESTDNGAAWKFCEGNPTGVVDIKSHYPSLARQLSYPQPKLVTDVGGFMMTFIQVNGEWEMDKHTRTSMLQKIQSKSRTDPVFRERWNAAMERVQREQSR